jgi:hypothetical protein
MAIVSLLAEEAIMFEPLIALGLFGGVVWVVSHAIFLIMHTDRGNDILPEYRDTIATFVQENYGSHFGHANSLGEESLRKL